MRIGPCISSTRLPRSRRALKPPAAGQEGYAEFMKNQDGYRLSKEYPVEGVSCLDKVITKYMGGNEFTEE